MEIINLTKIIAKKEFHSSYWRISIAKTSGDENDSCFIHCCLHVR